MAQLEGNWVVSRPDLGDWYMTCLATVTGEKLESPVVTDLRENSYSGEYLTPGNPAAGESSTDQGMAMIRLCISFPDDGTLAHVPRPCGIRCRVR
jgi:hypothetical protein